MKFFLQILIAGSVLMAGCASHSYCLKQQRYEKAKSIKPLETGADLSLPQSVTALTVPPPPAKDQPFGVLVADGKTRRAQCLDQPPPLPAAAQAPPAS